MINRPNYIVKKRIIIIFFVLLFIFIFFLIKLTSIQLINNEDYQEKALEQRLRHLQVEPKRGIIYDRNGEDLAVSASSETVVAIPPEIKNPQKTAEKLAPYLKLDQSEIYKKLNSNNSAVYVERKLDEEKINELKKLELEGIFFKEESKRFYPNDNLASHIIGFAGIDSQGLDGIELSYDSELKGIPGSIAAERDASGRTIPEGVKDYLAPRDGDNLYLTIDEVIQYIAERELNKAMNNFNISGGTIIVMDPQQGDILALANKPDYNPNNFSDFTQKEWRNRAISDSFEPGSTFKIITTAAALEEGVVNENDPFSCSGHIKVSGEQINCWKYGGHGHQSFEEVVENSCNPGFVQVGMKLGREKYYDYIKGFGFGERTDIKLPGETDGLVYEYEDIGPVELATMSFGHGITVTPIQLTTAVSAVANNGELLKPRLVKKIENEEGKVVEDKSPRHRRQIISAETAQRTRNLLENVVSEGTGQSARIEGYKIGGKTGTARHYREEEYDSSFIGIVPVDDPQLVISVVLYDVTGSPYYGSQTAAPVFRSVTMDTLRYLDIPPNLTSKNEKTEPESVVVPEMLDENVYSAQQELKDNGFETIITGEGDKVIKQVPAPGAKINENSTILLFTDQSSLEDKNYYIAVPDLIGLTEEKAEKITSQLGLKIKITDREEDSEKIAEQKPEAGQRVRAETEIEVKISSPK
ncbi:MAG: stage V sporulation protein D [Halanaerobiales bacterium]